MKIHFPIIYICFLLLTGSASAQTAGCTDPLANNYNPSATINNGSCLYDPASVSPVSGFNLANTLMETSGLLCWNNQLWTHNDSEDINLYALDSTNGSLLQSYALNGKTNTDWEEISQDADYLYIGDFGNNSNGNRADLKILRIDKNSLLADSPLIETIYFSYSNQTDFSPAGSNNTDFDCEAFIVSSDSIFLFTKEWISGKTSVYSLPKIPGTYSARLKSTFDVQGLITGATFLESKKLIVLSGYSKALQPFIYLLYDFRGTEFFSGNKRKANLALPFHQVEGIATSNGLKYYISNEYFTQSQYIDTPQKLHILDLTFYLGGYIGNLYNFSDIQSVNNDLIFPNPATDVINITTAISHLPTLYQVINQSGHIVLTGKLKEENQSVNITGLPAGVYLVKIDKYKTQSFKVIKR